MEIFLKQEISHSLTRKFCLVKWNGFEVVNFLVFLWKLRRFIPKPFFNRTRMRFKLESKFHFESNLCQFILTWKFYFKSNPKFLTFRTRKQLNLCIDWSSELKFCKFQYFPTKTTNSFFIFIRKWKYQNSSDLKFTSKSEKKRNPIRFFIVINAHSFPCFPFNVFSPSLAAVLHNNKKKGTIDSKG